MENVSLMDIYQVVVNLQNNMVKMQETMLSMQADIHRLDKKTDLISQELKETENRLTNLEKFAETRGYVKVCEPESKYDVE